MNTLRKQNGFTVLELIVAVSVMALLALIAVPNFSTMKGQMEASQEIRLLAEQISELRGEAIRLRTTVRISFSSTGYSWDVEDDGDADGERVFAGESQWQGTTPATIVLNGLGLARGITSETTLTVANRGQSASMTINRNGHLQL